jgi:protein-S-isoprenylcysteine O-methyltransferase Ste14
VPEEFQRDRLPLAVFAPLTVIASLVVSAWDAFVLRHGVELYGSIGIMGFAMLFYGLGIFAAGRISLGKQFSFKVRVRPDHRLVTSGLYSYVRHPIYLGVILYALSAPIILESLYGFVVMLALVPLILHRIRVEESALTAKFGLEYTEYVRRTKRLIPFVY